MSLTAMLRQQQRDIIELLVNFTRDLETPDLAARAGLLRAQLTRIASKLRIHLSMEDGAMYPALLSSSEDRSQELARQSQSEAGDLAVRFQRFIRRWPSAHAIASAPDEFRSETEDILGDLAYRMIREADQLYPLLDAPLAPLRRAGC